MTQFTPPNPNDATVSIITKAIKIYSDNPIHDAIDRIIDSCACIDDGSDLSGMAAIKLVEAADELLELALDLCGKDSDEMNKIKNEQKYNNR